MQANTGNGFQRQTMLLNIKQQPHIKPQNFCTNLVQTRGMHLVNRKIGQSLLKDRFLG